MGSRTTSWSKRSSRIISYAAQFTLEQLEQRKLLTVDVAGVPNWLEQGPGPIKGGGVRGIPNQPVVGAVTCIAVAPKQVLGNTTMWIGTAGGGIWKTTDNGDHWEPKTDQLPSLSISCIAQDPVDGNILWAGTGSVSSSSSPGVFAGVLKSTDGGETWRSEPGTLLSGRQINDILITRIDSGNSHRVLIATDDGLYRYDGGALQHVQVNKNPPNANKRFSEVSDLERDPGSDNTFYAAIPGEGIFVSIDGGVGWNPTGALPAVASGGSRVDRTIRIEMSVSGAQASNGKYPLYAAMIERATEVLAGTPTVADEIEVSADALFAVGDEVTIFYDGKKNEKRDIVAISAPSNGIRRLTLDRDLVDTLTSTNTISVVTTKKRVSGLFRSDDNGATWSAMGRPSDADGGITPGGQGERHFSMLADRNSPDIVYVGGDRQPKAGPDHVEGTKDDAFPNATGATGYFGRLFRGTYTGANSASWASMTDNAASDTAPHADSRFMAFDPNLTDDILEADDGGIYRLHNPSSASRKWQSVNGNLRNTEFLSVAWQSATSRIIGGTQDNGVSYQPALGFADWNSVAGGDGGIVGAIGSEVIYSSQRLANFRIGSRAPQLQVRYAVSGTTLKTLKDFDSTLQFYQPYVVNSVDPTRMLFGTSYLYETEDKPSFSPSSRLADVLTPLGGTPVRTGGKAAPNPSAFVGNVNRNAMVFGGKLGLFPFADLGIVGTNGDKNGNCLFIRTGKKYDAFQPVTSWTTKVKTAVVAIAVDPTDWTRIYVLDALSRIWLTEDGAKKSNADWTWTEISAKTNNLQALAGAGSNLQDIAIYRPQGSSKLAILVGGQGGLFRRIDEVGGTQGMWTEYGGGPVDPDGNVVKYGGGLPNAMVTDIQFTTNDKVLVATMGRGAFTATVDDLLTPGAVSIIGTAAADVIKLVRDAKRPWLLNVYQYVVGTTPEPDPVKVIPLAALDTISIQGAGGSDKIIIDYSNGAISVPNGILVDGGNDSPSANQDSLQFPTPASKARRAASITTLDLTSGVKETLTTSKDPFGDEGTQTVIWKGIEVPPPEKQLATPEISLSIGAVKVVKAAKPAAKKAAKKTKVAGAFNLQSVLAGMDGRRKGEEAPSHDLSTSEEGEEEEEFDGATSILQRVIEEGDSGINLWSIGEEGSLISDLASLRAALDALDDVPGNVKLDTTSDQDGDGAADTLLTVQILDRRLDGLVNLEVDAELALGHVALRGELEVEASVDVNLVLGVDSNGFFLKPSTPGLPAIRIHDIEVDGEIEGEGRFGFLGVELEEGELEVDPDAAVEINFMDPGTGDSPDKIRLDELDVNDATDLVAINVKGDPGDGVDDLIIGGEFEVAAYFGEDVEPLFDVDAELHWEDLSNPTGVDLELEADSKIGAFLETDATNFINTLRGSAEQIKQMTGVDIFAQKIPMLEKSLNDILGGSVEESFGDTQILEIGAVVTDGSSKTFIVTLENLDPQARGIAVGNAVRFKGTDDVDYAGTIAAVNHGSFTVRYDSGIAAGPKTGSSALVKVTRQGSIPDMMKSWLGDLADPVGLTERVPTFQELAAALGVDLGLVSISGDGLEMPIDFKLDPIHFTKKLDLGTKIAGLKLSASGDVDVEISPTFHFTAGLRFSAGVPAAERVYLKQDDAPEMKLGVKVTLDNPTASGSIGFLDVQLAEDGSNNGISFAGNLTLNMKDTSGDGRIVLSELTPANLLSSFQAGISADLAIDPLKITASLGSDSVSNLGSIKIKLDAADGHVASLADLTNLPSKIQVSGESNFSSFQNITPQMIVEALQALIEKLRALGGGGVLDTKLPIIEKSLSDLVDLGQEFADRLGLLDPNGISTAKKLEEFLQDRLGDKTKLGSTDGDSIVVVKVTPDAIQLSLTVDQKIHRTLPFSLDLGDKWSVFEVQGAGSVDFNGFALGQLSVGVLTGANIPLAQRVYLDTDGADASRITISGAANLGYGAGSPFNASVKLGFLDFDIVGARALVDLTEMTGQVKDPGDGGEGAGRLTLQEIGEKVVAGKFGDILGGTFDGRIQARLPLDGDNDNKVGLPGAGSKDALIELAGKLQNLPNGFTFSIDPGLHTDTDEPLTNAALSDGVLGTTNQVMVYAHNLDNLIAGAVLDFDNLLAGLQKLVEWGDKLLGIGALDVKLPFTGAKIRDAMNFFKDPSGPFKKLTDAINGSGGLGAQPNDLVAQTAATKIKNALAAIPGVTPIGNLLDFQKDSNNRVTGATFKFKITSDFSLPLNLGKLDLGLDYLNLKSDADLAVLGSIQMVVGLGIDKSHDGFYLITDFTSDGITDPEFAIKDLRLRLNGNATVDMGFLHFNAAFDPVKNFVNASFGADLNGLGDGRLTLSELSDFARLPAMVDGNAATPGLDGLKLEVIANMDVPLSIASNPNFPSLSTNFHLAWGPFNLSDVQKGASAFTTPAVELKDLRLNAGEFLSKAALPFFRQLEKYNVLAPIIDKLDDPIPVIGGTLFDLFITKNPLLSQQQKDVASFLFNVGKTIDSFNNVIADAQTLSLKFGDVGIKPDRTLDTSKASETGQAGSPPAPEQYPGDHLPFVGDLIHDLGGIGITFPALKLSNLVQLFMGNDLDLVFANLPELHAGKEFTGEIPIVSVGIPYIASASVNAVFGGAIDLYVNLAGGLDSSGLHKGLDHLLDGLYIGDFDPGDDHKIAPGDVDRPEVYIEASITAGINTKVELFGLDLFKVTGAVRLSGAVSLDLNDDNDNFAPPGDPRDDGARYDGKFYIGEIRQVIDSAGGEPFCMFDLLGELAAKISFEIHIPYAPNPDWSHRWSLMTFDVECAPDPIVADFADLVGTKLVLTSTNDTSHAAYHSRAISNHEDGDDVEIFLIDKNGDAADGVETLRIRKGGLTEDFGPGESGNNYIANVADITLITDEGDGSAKFKRKDFGDGADHVRVDPAIHAPVRFHGGAGNDTLIGGDGGGILLGDEGDDYLALAPAPAGLTDVQRLLRGALLYGGDGNDQIFGGVGNDTVLGGEGNDTLDGGGGESDSGSDTIIGGGGDDMIDGRGQADVLVGDYDDFRDPRPGTPSEGSDFITGGGGADSIWGDNHGTSNGADGTQAASPLATGDFLFGGDGTDLIFGGAGNDYIQTGTAGVILNITNRAFGGTGNDTILGGVNRDSLVGGAGDDSIDGGAGSDALYAGDDTFGPNLSGQGFDLLIGGDGGDVIDGSDANSVTVRGDAGNDTILGSRGADNISGGANRDYIIAGPGGDLVSGGSGDDDIIGGKGSAGGVSFDVSQADGSDNITGDEGNDVIIGDNGTIDATTRAASTTEAGGFGADTIAGGAGTDSILGGGGGDRIDGDADADVIVGDLGAINAGAITVTPSSTGGKDTASGGDGDDILIGGDAGDDLLGGAGADLLLGDYGSVDRTVALNVRFKSTSTQAASGGNDVIHGDGGDDTAIGGQGADKIYGGEGNDDLIGGHNVAGGKDGADSIDGEAGNDVVAGDNASIVRRLDNESRNTRALAGAKLYTSAGAANVTTSKQKSVDLVAGRDITFFDHSAAADATLFGGDYLAGGAGHDSVFGQMGNDIMQGDGSIALSVSATSPSASGSTDGNDYMEGNGGSDTMFGNLGQDDLIGGSSSLFGLTDRPDGADLIFGGSGGEIARNSAGDTTPGGHARDADVIVGDNGNIYRILLVDQSTQYARFNYDDYAGGVRVIPRAVDLIDYSADGVAGNDVGSGDVLYGEAGDDSIHGESGNDYVLGDGQDDHLFGESGDDWLSGGTGDDGMIGDDGKIMTSRNGTPEPLYGILASTQEAISVKSLQLAATVDVKGQLKHTVDLEPFAIGGADVMYGGLGNDSMHGGAGQDLISGAEALPEFYNPPVVPTLAFTGGKFAVFNYNSPRARIANHPLNFEAYRGSLANFINDGNDAIFGDAGNDWLVGGTGSDRLYGGYGDDVLNVDDNLETADTPDTGNYEGADLAFGGAGRDTMLGNAFADRLIDWVGEFNNYYVPFNPFGQAAVVRQISSPLTSFLYRLSASDGADPTRSGTGLGSASRNGEPFGELSLIEQQDKDWRDQNGPPVGPQPQ